MNLLKVLFLSSIFINQVQANCPTDECPKLEGTFKNCQITSVTSDKQRTENKVTDIFQRGIDAGALDMEFTQETITEGTHGISPIHLYSDPYNEYMTNNKLLKNKSGEYTRSWCQGGILYTNIYTKKNESSLDSETSYQINPQDKNVEIVFRGDLIGRGEVTTVQFKCDLK